MDDPMLNSDLILKALLKTNRPPTDEEKASMCEEIASNIEKLKALQIEIPDTMAHIEALRLQIHHAEIKLQRLVNERADILKTSEDHHRVFSAARNLPEDVLREILIACVDDKAPPTLSYREHPLPYRLAQLSSGIRRIALATPIIWASMEILVDSFYFGNSDEQVYSSLASRIREWNGRARGLTLTVFMEIPNDFQYIYLDPGEPDPSHILFDAIFSYSSRWKNIRFNSFCEGAPASVLRFTALTPADVPMLQSVVLCLSCPSSSSYWKRSKHVIFKVPTLRHILLDTDDVRNFLVNWAALTTMSLWTKSSNHSYSKNEIAGIFRQTKCLVTCDILVGPPRLEEEIILDEIRLPFLKTLHMHESVDRFALSTSPEGQSLLDLITAPVLAEFYIYGTFLELSLLNFFKRSPNILELKLPYLKIDEYFTITMEFLRHCPSLNALYLYPCNRDRSDQMSNWDANTLLRSFIAGEGDAGVTCPRLQFATVTGEPTFSLDTLHLFLEGKQGSRATPNIAPWKKVIIQIQGVTEKETQQQMLDLVSQKKAEGLDVECPQSFHDEYEPIM